MLKLHRERSDSGLIIDIPVPDVAAYLDESMAALAVGNGRGRLLAAEHLHGLDGLFLARHAEVKNRSECFNLSQFGCRIMARDRNLKNYCDFEKFTLQS